MIIVNFSIIVINDYCYYYYYYYYYLLNCISYISICIITIFFWLLSVVFIIVQALNKISNSVTERRMFISRPQSTLDRIWYLVY